MSHNPRVILKPNKLRLSRAQEDKLMDHVKKRHDDTKVEMGFMTKAGEYTGWMDKRRQAFAEYTNDFEHRKNAAKYGPLYQVFNDCSVNIPQRAVRIYKARACEALLNSHPFAGLTPEGAEDKPRITTPPGVKPPADPIALAERYWNHALLLAEANIHFRDGIEKAAVGGEVVNKITLKIDDESCDEDEEKAIWLDGTGEPLRDTRGRFVFIDEKFEPDPDRVEGEILSRDPSVIKMPDAAISEELYPVEVREPRKVLNIEPVGYQSFICSPTAKTIQRDGTDYIAHEFDFTLDQLWAITSSKNLGPEARSWRENLKSQSSAAKSDVSQPVESRGEVERGLSAPVVLHLAESWITYDARERGQCDEICVLWDVTTGYPLHYDLNKEVTPTRTKRRPFEVDRIIPVPDRWYGMGFYEFLSTDHQFVDRQLARIETRTSTSGRFTYWREGTLKDVEGGWDIDLNSPKIYTATSALQPGQKPLEHIELPPMDERLWQLVDLRIQHALLKSGTMASADAAAAKLNPSKTARGQELLQAESELMSNDTTQDARRGIEAALKQSLLAVFAEYTHESAAELLGAENAEILSKWLKTTPLRLIENFVKLLMTKAKSQMQIDANTQAIQIVTGGKPWIEVVAMSQAGQLPPDLPNKVKPLYRAVLDSNGIDGAEGILEFSEFVPQLPAGAPNSPMTPNGQPAAPTPNLLAA